MDRSERVLIALPWTSKERVGGQVVVTPIEYTGDMRGGRWLCEVVSSTHPSYPVGGSLSVSVNRLAAGERITP